MVGKCAGILFWELDAFRWRFSLKIHWIQKIFRKILVGFPIIIPWLHPHITVVTSIGCPGGWGHAGSGAGKVAWDLSFCDRAAGIHQQKKGIYVYIYIIYIYIYNNIFYQTWDKIEKRHFVRAVNFAMGVDAPATRGFFWAIAKWRWLRVSPWWWWYG